MTSGMGLVLGKVPKFIFRGRKIIFRYIFLLYFCNCHEFRKITPGLDLVVGGIRKFIFNDRKIISRCIFLLYSYNYHGFLLICFLKLDFSSIYFLLCKNKIFDLSWVNY